MQALNDVAKYVHRSAHQFLAFHLADQRSVFGGRQRALPLRRVHQRNATWRLPACVQYGVNGSPTTARTDGTQRAMTETLLQTAMQNAWINGGSPDYALTGPKQKRAISAFTGGTTKFYKVEDRKLTATIDVYVGDFGQLKIVASRFTRGAATAADREVHVIDPSLIGIATLRPIKTVDVAATGDAEKAVILTELTLEVRQEAGIALIADLT